MFGFMQMSPAKKVVALVIALALLGAGVWLYTSQGAATQNGGGEQTFCTLDAMQCPDGSWVGRSGPNCEFVCPGTAN